MKFFTLVAHEKSKAVIGVEGMFNQNSFVRSQRRKSRAAAAKVVVVSAMLFVIAVGVIASIHLSSPTSTASTPKEPLKKVLEPGMVEVIVPIENIPPGATLVPTMFHKVAKPEIVINPEIIRDLDEIKGLYSRGMLVAEQPMHRDFLTSLQPVNALTASIPHGFRAVAIAVDATSSVEGWAQPGAQVDVIWVTKDYGPQMAYVVASNAKVLSANKKAQGARPDKTSSTETPTTVTLLLSVKDAMRVRLAAMNGRLALVLRGMEPEKPRPLNPISEGALVNVASRPRVPLQRRIIDVKVRDRQTGDIETLQFENGQKISE